MTTIPYARARLVLFDLDDTLCDYAQARARRLDHAFRLAARHDGVSLPDDLQPLIAESIRRHPHGIDHFGELLRPFGVSDEAIALGMHWFVRHRFYTLQNFPDALLTLEKARAALPGRRIGIVTNGPADVQRQKISRLGLGDHVDFVLISGEFGHAKPAREIFEESLRLGEAGAADSVFIGDSPEFDITGARGVGMPAIWVNRTAQSWPLPTPPPDCVARDLAEVRKLLGI